MPLPPPPAPSPLPRQALSIPEARPTPPPSRSELDDTSTVLAPPFPERRGGGDQSKPLGPSPGLAWPGPRPYLGEPLPSACWPGHCWVTAGGHLQQPFRGSEESTFSFEEHCGRLAAGCTRSQALSAPGLVPALRPRRPIWETGTLACCGSIPTTACSPRAGGADEGFGNY